MNLRKHIFIHTLTLCFAIGGLFLWSITNAQNDLMEEAFGSAKSYDTILDLGNTKESVGNNILRESASVEMNENLGNWCFINWQFVNVDENGCLERGGDWDVTMMDVTTQAPLIVRITKFLLRMTIVLSITMVIFNAIVYMIEVLSGKDRKSAEAKNNLAWVVGGVVIALMSVGIINLVVSIPKSSLITSDDMWMFEIWCQTWWTTVFWDDLKSWICIYSTFGHPDNTMLYRERDQNGIWNRCYICDDWNTWCSRKAITNTEMEDKCVEDMWWTVFK